MTPDDVVYVSLGDPIILSCLAEGTPVPEILWYRDNELVQTSPSLAVANDGTELRISSIRQEDIGDYTCAAKNGQGSVRHSTKLVVAGTLPAFIEILLLMHKFEALALANNHEQFVKETCSIYRALHTAKYRC